MTSGDVPRPLPPTCREAAYPSTLDKAAALLHSVVQNHALVDGDERLGFLVTAAFVELNGHVTDPDDEDGWFDLIVDVASGDRLAPLCRPRPA